VLALAYFVVLHPNIRYFGRRGNSRREHHRRERYGREERSERHQAEAGSGAARQAISETRYFAD